MNKNFEKNYEQLVSLDQIIKDAKILCENSKIDFDPSKVYFTCSYDPYIIMFYEE